MVIVLSPAKKLAENQTVSSLSLTLENKKNISFTQPKLLNESKTLANILKQKSIYELTSLMSISEKLATLNHSRWQQWLPTPKKIPANENNKYFPAIYLFQGDVYQGIDAKSLSANEIKKMNSFTYILSGLYGALKPLDLIMPYRLEMGTNLKTLKGNDLIAYWSNRIAKLINVECEKSKLLINLASEEYFKAIRSNLDSNIKIIQPIFFDLINDQYKMVSFYTKKARGLMARYLTKTWSNSSTQSLSSASTYLKQFNSDGYYFNSKATAQYIEHKQKRTSDVSVKSETNINYLVFYRNH